MWGPCRPRPTKCCLTVVLAALVVVVLGQFVCLYLALPEARLWTPAADDEDDEEEEQDPDWRGAIQEEIEEARERLLRRRSEEAALNRTSSAPPPPPILVTNQAFSRHCQVYVRPGAAAARERLSITTRTTPFKLYVHDLPAEFNADLVRCIERRFHQDGCSNTDHCGYGGRLANLTSDLYVHDTWRSSLELILHHKLLYSSYRTMDPYAADAFYVPYYPALDCICRADGRKLANHSDWLFRFLRGTGWFGRRYSKPHLMALGLSQREHFSPSCPLLRHPNATLLTFVGVEQEEGEGEASSSSSSTSGRSLQKRLRRNLTVISVPYPSYGHLNTFSHHELPSPTLLRSTTTDHHRNVFLLLTAGQQRTTTRTNTPDGRTFQEFAGHETHVSYQRFSDQQGNMTSHHRKVWLVTSECRGNHKYVTLSWMLHSVFCLQPPGDSAVGRAFFDAIMGGCIPVLSHHHHRHHHSARAGVKFPFADRLDYGEFTVTLPQGVNDTLAYLEGLPAETVKAYQRGVLQALPHLQYSFPITDGEHKDAVQYMLDEVYNKHIPKGPT